MTKVKKQYKYYVFLLVIVLLSLAFFSFGFNITFADVDVHTYSNVLEDLQKDESFNFEDYPLIETDYSLQVIQIAESVDKELFIYVYQPSATTKNLQATSINISTEIRNKLSYKNYKLELLNFDSVFYKFKVEDFKIKEDDVRYYEISNIYRNWIEEDYTPGHDNTVSETGYEVGKLYSVSGQNENIVYLVKDTEVVTVTDKFVGFVSYPDGYHLFKPNVSCHSHFVAFSTDKDIDKLYDAEVYFQTQYVEQVTTWNPEQSDKATFGRPKSDNYNNLTYTDKGSWSSSGWKNHKYTWSRISDTETFFKETEKQHIYRGAILDEFLKVELKDDAENAIKNKQWVLRFFESDYSVVVNVIPELGYASGVEKRTMVTDVSVLRLKFEKDGRVYNLGVVDNKQTGSDKPVNDVKTTFKLARWIKVALAIIGSLIGLALLAPFLPAILTFMMFILLWVLKGLWWLIKAPFTIFFD